MIEFSDRDARLYLAHVAEYPAPQIRAYAVDDGVIGAASAIRAGTAPAEVQREARRSDISIDEDIQRIALGQPLLAPTQPGWPGFTLAALDPVDRPLALCVRGSGSLAERLAAAAVEPPGCPSQKDDGACSKRSVWVPTAGDGRLGRPPAG